MATALAHVQKPVPRLADVRPDLPVDLTDLVGSMLVKEPDRRVGSALALSGALNAANKRLGLPSSEPGASLHLQRAKPSARDATEPAPPGPASALHGQASPAPSSDDGVDGTSVFGDGEVREGTSVLPSGGAAKPMGAATVPPSDDELVAGLGPSQRGTARGPGAPPLGGKAANQGAQRDRRHRTGRRAAVAVAMLMVAGSAVALVVFRHQPPTKPSAAGHSLGAHGNVPPTAPLPPAGTYPVVPVAAVYELAINGNHADDDLAGLANVIGDNPNADWVSAQYHGPRFGGWGGLGLVLKLSGAHKLHELVVTTPMQGWSAETFVGNDFAKNLSGWGRPVGQLQDVNGSQRLSLGNERASWALFWMLDPGPQEQAVVDKLAVH